MTRAEIIAQAVREAEELNAKIAAGYDFAAEIAAAEKALADEEAAYYGTGMADFAAKCFARAQQRTYPGQCRQR